MIEYGLTFLTGLFSSLHCIGMCGVIVLAYSTQATPQVPQRKTIQNMLLHAAYNSGRILSYSLLGGMLGSIGMTIGLIKGIGEYFSIISGCIMVISGIALLGILPISTSIALIGSNSSITKIQSQLLFKRTPASKLSLGLLTPLLPCGILYAMLAKAAASGTMVNGAMTMGVFALGMAPALMLLGSISSFFSARMRKGAEQVAAIFIILMGAALILRGFHIPYLSWFSAEQTCPNCAS